MMHLAILPLAVRGMPAMRAVGTRTLVLQMSTYATFKTSKGDFKARGARPLPADPTVCQRSPRTDARTDRPAPRSARRRCCCSSTSHPPQRQP